jgi:hypothetical protein
MAADTINGYLKLGKTTVLECLEYYCVCIIEFHFNDERDSNYDENYHTITSVVASHVNYEASASLASILDEDTTPMDTNNTPQADIQGPITRARARQLNLQVISFLRNYSYAFESSMLPNDLIVLRNEGEDQQGLGERPWRRGGPAWTSGSRWKTKPVRLRFSFGLQEQPVLKRTPMSHTESDLDVLYMDGNIISRSFQWNQFQAQIHPESTGIICTS